MRGALLSLLLFLPAAPAAAALSPPEARMAATVEAELPRTLAVLEKMVNVNSGTMNLAGVEEVGRMTRAELEPLGFTVRWLPMPRTGRAGHLVAAHEGRPGTKRLLLIGHLDTVFERDSPFQRFARQGDRIVGPGVNDMKGGNMVIVSALRAMRDAGTLKDANIEIMLSGDEEDAGDPQGTARAELVAMGRRADVALDFESLVRQDGRDIGSIARRGSIGWRLDATGRTGHSSGVFSDAAGYGASYELARIVDAFRRELREPGLTYNLALLVGGTVAAVDPAEIGGTAQAKANIIPAQAHATGDIRALSNDQALRTEARMRAIVRQSLPGTSATITFHDGYPAMAPTAAARAILAALNDVNRDLGLPAMDALDPLKRGAGDIAFVADDVPAGFVGMGPYGEKGHAEGEWAEVASFVRQGRRAAILMTRLSREKR